MEHGAKKCDVPAIQESDLQDAERDGRRHKIEEMKEFLDKQINESLAYDEQLFMRLVGKITMYEDRLTVEFKSGLEINVER